MDQSIRQIQRLGWEFRPDGIAGQGPGVLFTVRISGQDVRTFVPLHRVWVTFDQELQAVGCPSAASVGAPYSVGGFFSFIKKAASGVVNKVVPKAIRKAAAKVVSVAKSAAKMMVPYIQSAASFVPGVGTGLSAALGGAMALASGRRIDQAFIEAAKSAIPGGPLARAAFSVASDALQGKRIDTIALNALPLPPAQKSALTRAISAAKDLAAGKRVDRIVMDQAMRQLPPELQKAVHVGTQIGHAKSLQSAASSAAHGAMQLARDYNHGIAAAQHFASGARSPATLAAMQRAVDSRAALSRIVRSASKGHPQATNILHAFRALSAPRVPFRAPALPSLRNFGFA